MDEVLFVHYRMLLMARLSNGWKKFNANRKEVFFSLLVLGMLAEAAIFQVTSYVPVDNNIFFHSFAIALILFLLSVYVPLGTDNWRWAMVFTAGILLWWSQVYWKYIERFVAQPKVFTSSGYKGYQYANEVNRHTYMIDLDTTDIPLSQWREPNLKTFQKILLPNPTVDGIERLMNNPLVKQKKPLNVLNMSELTPLAAEIPFSLEASLHILFGITKVWQCSRKRQIHSAIGLRITITILSYLNTSLISITFIHTK